MDFLGNKKYFFGEVISLLDIGVFTVVAGLLFFDRGEFNNQL
jgi:hypothetical protein